MARINKIETKKEDKDEKSKLEKELFVDKKSAWELLGKEKKEAFDLAKEYKRFVDANKTEREIVDAVEGMAKRAGYTPLKEATAGTKKNIRNKPQQKHFTY